GGRAQAVAARHLDVHDDEIGRQPCDLGQGLVAVAGFPDYLDPLDVAEEGAQAIEGKRLVIHQQYAHRLPVPAKFGRSFPTPRRRSQFASLISGTQILAMKRSPSGPAARLARGPNTAFKRRRTFSR